MNEAYRPYRHSMPRFVPVRGLDYHLQVWGDPSLVTPRRPPLLLMHGWMDVGASFQFVVDALTHERLVVAPDWRGFGLTGKPAADSYWFPDYLGDLDALVEHVAPGGAPVDLVGHSMGGNIVMSYAGVRPGRIRHLVNLEGFGMPAMQPEDAPKRLLQWLDELRRPQSLQSYASVDEVAARLLKNNPLLSPEKAAWLAPHWSRREADGRWHILGDPAHKRINPVPFHRAEVLEIWKRIEAPVLWVEGDHSEFQKWWGHRYPREDFEQRLAVIRRLQRHQFSPCGHMLHHDQPEALASLLESFLDDA